jgi:hypothetical protein
MRRRTRNVVEAAEATGTLWGLLVSGLVRLGAWLRGSR